MRYSPRQFSALCVLALPVIVGCTADLSKLRAPSHRDAALGADLPPSDLRFPSQVTEPDVQAADQIDDAPGIETAEAGSYGAGGSMGGAIGAGGTAGTAGIGGAGGDVGVGGAESGGATSTGGTAFDGDAMVADVASSETAAAELGSSLPDGSPVRSGDDAADGTFDLPRDSAGDPSIDVALDVPRDALSPDSAPGTMTCPATILGSLDSSDQVQVGRLSRIGPISACGISKRYPGNSSDPTNSHLCDIYRFVNPTHTPVCFNFTLRYEGSQLYAAAYASFDRTDISKSYLGDVGDVLTSPQGMGISIGAASTVDVVVYAVAIGTAPAGSYTLSCSAQ